MFSAKCESTFRFDKGTIFYETGLKKAWTQMLLNVAVMFPRMADGGYVFIKPKFRNLTIFIRWNAASRTVIKIWTKMQQELTRNIHFFLLFQYNFLEIYSACALSPHRRLQTPVNSRI